MDAAARRRWLAILPHLTDEDRERLREILIETSGDSASQPGRGDLTPQLGRGDLTPQPPLRAGEGGWGGEVSPAGLGGEVSPVGLRGEVSPVRLGGEVSPAPLPLILADLPAEPLLAVAPLLAARGWYVVPVVQRWIASPAVLPCRQLVERLLTAGRRMQRPAEPRGAILIADGERTGPPGYPQLVPGRTFDNRYEYQICRFPSPHFLEAHGVRRVHWITAELPAGDSGSGVAPRTLGLPPVARDLHPYREALLQAGIEVDITLWLGA